MDITDVGTNFVINAQAFDTALSDTQSAADPGNKDNALSQDSMKVADAKYAYIQDPNAHNGYALIEAFNTFSADALKNVQKNGGSSAEVIKDLLSLIGTLSQEPNTAGTGSGDPELAKKIRDANEKYKHDDSASKLNWLRLPEDRWNLMKLKAQADKEGLDADGWLKMYDNRKNGNRTEGTFEKAVGSNLALSGSSNTATGTNIVAVGNGNTANGNFLDLLGAYNSVSGFHDIAIGSKNSVTGSYDTAVGNSNSVDGNNDTVYGDNDKVHGNSAHVYGSGLEASKGQTVFGTKSNYTVVNADGSWKQVVDGKTASKGSSLTAAIASQEASASMSALQTAGANYAALSSQWSATGPLAASTIRDMRSAGIDIQNNA
jgi:hypothetical protein